MKKLLFTVLLATSASMSAQTEKGNWMIGGSTTLGFKHNSVKYKDSGYNTSGPKVSTTAFSPNVFYFIKDNLSIGAELGFINVVTKERDGNIHHKTTQNTLSFVPQAIYYFPIAGPLRPYLGAGTGYAHAKIKTSASGSTMDEIFDSKITVSGFNWKAKGGISYFKKSNIVLNLGLEYSQIIGKADMPYATLDEYNNIVRETKKINTRINDFGLNVGIAFFI